MNHRYCRIIFAGYYTVKFLNELIDLLVKILTLFNYFLPKKTNVISSLVSSL